MLKVYTAQDIINIFRPIVEANDLLQMYVTQAKLDDMFPTLGEYANRLDKAIKEAGKDGRELRR